MCVCVSEKIESWYSILFSPVVCCLLLGGGGGGWKLLGNKRTRSKPLGGTWAASPDVSVLRSAGGVGGPKQIFSRSM